MMILSMVATNLALLQEDCALSTLLDAFTIRVSFDMSVKSLTRVSHPLYLVVSQPLPYLYRLADSILHLSIPFPYHAQ